jgi:uncharacterized membrane protein
MPIGVWIILAILVIVALLFFVTKLNLDFLCKVEAIVTISIILVVGGALIYIVLLSFFDNEAAFMKLLKNAKECEII